MRVKKICSIGIVVFFYFSCISIETNFTEYTIHLIIDKGYSLSSRSCEITEVNYNNHQNLYTVLFKNVKGGHSKTIFSNKPCNIHDGHEGKRLNVYKNNILISSFSVNDFKVLQKDTIHLNNYLE